MKSNKILALMAGFCALMIITPIFAAGANVRIYASAIRTGERLEYNIVAGYAPLDYYDWVTTYTSMANISVETGGKIEATVNGTHDIAGEPEVYLDVVFKKATGAVNQSFWNETNGNNAINLVLGTWTNPIGLITFINWSHWNTSLFAELGTQLTKFERAPTLVTIVMNFTDASHQNTTLVYDSAVGVLKFAYTDTVYGGKLVLQLASSTIPLPSDAVIPGFPVEMLALAMLAGGIFVVMARKRSNHSEHL